MIRRRPGSTRTDKLCPYTTRFRSARWAGPQKDFDFAMEKVRLGLVEEGTLNTKAWFIAGLALAWPDGHVEYFEGRVDGELTWPPRGLKGLGYDPRSEEHTSELQSLMRISYAVFCLKK